MSGHATIDSAVMAVKMGAMDYLTKPFDLQRLRQLLASHARAALICGEIGTGKELVVRALHSLGPRSAKRVVTVNCSALLRRQRLAA
jgi:DNA-binding NtrC family response regulator